MAVSGPPPGVIASAIAVLGVGVDASWPEVRAAYRARIREVHPDVAPGDTTLLAAELNEALDVLRRATNGGVDPLPPPAPPPPRPPTQTVVGSTIEAPPVTLRAPAGDVFVQLLDAAYAVGDVCYIDPEDGLIQVLLDDARSRLLIDIDAGTEPARASFTLDSPDGEGAPAVADIVAAIGFHLAHPAD